MNLNPNRRSFFKLLFSAPASAWAVASLKQTPAERVVMLDDFHVAGVRYYEGRELLEELKAGEPLALRLQPANPHDKFAVEIFRGETKLGYIPRTHNQHISRMLEHGFELRCQIVRVNPHVDYWEAIFATVSLVTAGHGSGVMEHGHRPAVTI